MVADFLIVFTSTTIDRCFPTHALWHGWGTRHPACEQRILARVPGTCDVPKLLMLARMITSS